ncbi:MAG: Na-translocating system protein MpsC family protein [Solirubrobacteraceae bacterium]
MEHEDRGSMRSAISTAMVRRKAELYGKGPTRAKTFFNDDYVFVVMEGGLTANEEQLIDAGEEHLVRQYRLRFQEVTGDVLTGDVEQITGRKVVGYHSQITFQPTRIFEIFYLDEAPATGD